MSGRLPPPAHWQPIETAPTDGTEVLTWVPEDYFGSGGIEQAIFVDGQWQDSSGDSIHPTWWTPQPDAPNEVQDGHQHTTETETPTPVEERQCSAQAPSGSDGPRANEATSRDAARTPQTEIVTPPPAEPPQERTTALELLEHILRGHSAISDGHVIECDCGTTFWHPGPASPDPAVPPQEPPHKALLNTLLLDCIQITDDGALVCRHCEEGIAASENKPIPHEAGCVVGQIHAILRQPAVPPVTTPHDLEVLDDTRVDMEARKVLVRPQTVHPVQAKPFVAPVTTREDETRRLNWRRSPAPDSHTGNVVDETTGTRTFGIWARLNDLEEALTERDHFYNERSEVLDRLTAVEDERDTLKALLQRLRGDLDNFLEVDELAAIDALVGASIASSPREKL